MAAKHFADRGATGQVDAVDRSQDIGKHKRAGHVRHAAPRTREAAIGKLGTGPTMSIIAGIIVLVAVLVLFAVPRLLQQPTANAQEVTVTIPEGSGATAIASLLEKEAVIEDTDAFLSRLTERGDDSSLKPGTYSFSVPAEIDTIIDQLVAGPNITDSQITVPEGYTVQKTAELVQEKLGISADDFIAQAKASNYVSEYSFLSAAQNDSLEGFLWPKTYDFSGQELTADTVIRAMLNQYVSEVGLHDFKSAEASLKKTYGVDFDDYDVLIMASIIEREAVTADDRPKVASVFYNRLRDGMRLQSDATMGYVTGGPVTAADLKADSPYNTYLVDGLPPTPICTPSTESLEAALHPATTNYLYFLIIEDGTQSVHEFSETYEQHQAAIERYGSS